MSVLDEETITRIKSLLKHHPKGMMISDLSSHMKINRNIMSKYLDILLMSGHVEMEVRGNAKVFSLSQRTPISNMFEFSSDYVIVLDGKEKILWVNTPILSLLGKNPADFAGRSLREIDDPFFSCLPHGENPETGDNLSEICCQIKGESLYFRVKQTPAVLTDGNTGSILTCEDITTERIFQQMVDLSETRFRAIVEDQTEFITRFLPDGTLTFVNGSYARHLGKKPEELAGILYLPDIPEHERALIYGQIRSLDRDHAIMSVEVRKSGGDGKTCSQQWTVRVLFDNAGNLMEYQAVGRDITEQAEAADHMRRHAADMEFISRKAREFLELPPEADLYAAIAEGLFELLPEAYNHVCSFDPKSQELTSRNLCGIGAREAFKRIAGFDLVGFSFIVNDPAAIEFMRQNRLEKAFGDLYTALFGQVPYLVCKQIEKVMNVDEIYVLGLVSHGDLLGVVAILPRKGSPIPNPGLVEAFLRQASLVLAWRKASEALQKSEAQFRAIVEDQTEFIARFRPDGSLTFVNRSYARYLGKAPQDLTGLQHVPYIVREVIPLLKQRSGEPGQNNLVTTVQCREMNPAGSVRWQEWTVRALENAKGKIAEFQSVGRDVTELHEAEESTRQHLADMEFLSRKAREFLELPSGADIYHEILYGLRELASDATITVSSFDPHTSAIAIRSVWSEEVATVFKKLTGEDLIGKSFVVSDPDAVAGMKSGIIRRIPGDLYYTMFGTVPIIICQQIEETFKMGSDKFSAGMVSRDCLLGVVMIAPRNGQRLVRQNLIETFLQQASIALAQRLDADALKQSEERFRGIIEDQTEFVTRFLPDGTLTFVNAPLCRVMNKDPADLLGRSFFSLIPDDDRRVLTTSLESLTKKNPKTTIEHRVTGPDGEIRWFQWNNRAIFDDQGHVVEFDGIGRDITELHDAAAKARQHLTDMEFLAGSAGELVLIKDPDGVHRFVSEKIRNLLPGSLVAIVSFDQPGRMLQILRVDGDLKAVRILTSELNRDLPGMSFSLDGNTEYAALLTSRHLVPGPTLPGWLAGSISKETCARVSERLNLGRAYVMGLSSYDGTNDLVIIQLKAGTDISNRELVEAFVSQSAIALAHRQEEQE